MAPTTVADSAKDVDTRKSSQRKTNKPLIEKRRRARINDCLTQLKTIVLGSSDQQAGRTSKLEKADILEMTVEFVKSRLNDSSGSMEPKPLKNDTSIKCDPTYVAGYSECLHEISRFLEQSLRNNTTLKEKLERHMCDQLNSNSVTNLSGANASSNNAVCHTTQVQFVSSNCDEVIDLRKNVTNEKHAVELIRPNGLPTDTKTAVQQLTAIGQDMQLSQPIGWLFGEQCVLMIPCPPSLEPTQQPHIFRQIVPLTNNACFPGNSQSISTFPAQNAPNGVCSGRAHTCSAFSTPNAQPQYINSLDSTQYADMCSTPNGLSYSINSIQRSEGSACYIHVPSCLTMQPQTAHAHNVETIPYWRPW